MGPGSSALSRYVTLYEQLSRQQVAEERTGWSQGSRGHEPQHMVTISQQDGRCLWGRGWIQASPPFSAPTRSNNSIPVWYSAYRGKNYGEIIRREKTPPTLPPVHPMRRSKTVPSTAGTWYPGCPQTFLGALGPFPFPKRQYPWPRRGKVPLVSSTSALHLRLESLSDTLPHSTPHRKELVPCSLPSRSARALDHGGWSAGGSSPNHFSYRPPAIPPHSVHPLL